MLKLSPWIGIYYVSYDGDYHNASLQCLQSMHIAFLAYKHVERSALCTCDSQCNQYYCRTENEGLVFCESRAIVTESHKFHPTFPFFISRKSQKLQTRPLLKKYKFDHGS